MTAPDRLVEVSADRLARRGPGRDLRVGVDRLWDFLVETAPAGASMRVVYVASAGCLSVEGHASGGGDAGAGPGAGTVRVRADWSSSAGWRDATQLTEGRRRR